MLHNIMRRIGAELGSAQFTTVLAVVVVLAVPCVALLGQSSAATSWGSGDSAAQSLAGAGAGAAQAVAAANHGSFAATGLLALHKVALLPTQRSSRTAWVSSAQGTANTFSVTATAEPSGDTYTITRTAGGRVRQTCTVTGLADEGFSCRDLNSSGSGVW